MSRNWNVWLEEELKAAASSLIGQPIYLEHIDVANAVGKVTNAWWDSRERALYYEGEIYDDEVAAKIRTGLIQHVSIGADYQVLEPVNGQIPRGLRFRELSLVAAPGVPEANVQAVEHLFEKVMETKKIAAEKVVKDPPFGYLADVVLKLCIENRWLRRELKRLKEQFPKRVIVRL
jgi:hypothetical protein